MTINASLARYQHMLRGAALPACMHVPLRAQTATYSFVFPNSEGEYQRVFLPLLDLVNHAGEGANAGVYKDERSGEYSLTALRDIKCAAACFPLCALTRCCSMSRFGALHTFLFMWRVGPSGGVARILMHSQTCMPGEGVHGVPGAGRVRR